MTKYPSIPTYHTLGNKGALLEETVSFDSETAVAINVVRTVSWLDGIPHAATRISRFAALAAT